MRHARWFCAALLRMLPEAAALRVHCPKGAWPGKQEIRQCCSMNVQARGAGTWVADVAGFFGRDGQAAVWSGFILPAVQQSPRLAYHTAYHCILKCDIQLGEKVCG